MRNKWGKRFFVMMGLLYALHAGADVPIWAQVKNDFQSSESVLLDRTGKPLQSLRVNQQGRRLAWVPLTQISPALQEAVVRAEDQDFYQHDGVDWEALGGGVVDTLTGDKRGASTISMQVVGLIDPDLQRGPDGRSVLQKAGQVAAAQALDKSWSKAQILEAYLNLASFRGEAQGIAAISQQLFARSPDGLNQAQALVIASLLRAPNAASAQVAQRVCALADALNARTSCEQLQSMTRQALNARPTHQGPNQDAPEAARLLLKAPNAKVKSSLDGDLQRSVRAILRQQLNELKNRNVNDAAAVVLDNRTGEVLVYVGNSGRAASSVFVDGIAAKRQAGSTLKPFLYAQAMEQNLLTPASLLDDSPVNLSTQSGLYVPQNYDKDFKGVVSVRTALASSLNIPAVRALVLLGPDAFLQKLNELGIALPESGDFYGYALALGAADVGLLSLTNAYRTLANQGRHSEVRWRQGGAVGYVQALSPQASYIVSDILADRSARSLTFGLDNPLGTPYWTAVKTGTSKDMRDNWCIGYSSHYTVGVWVGNFDGEPMWDVSGISGAAPAWLQIMRQLQRRQPSQRPDPPAGLLQVRTLFAPQVEAARAEWFMPAMLSSNTQVVMNQVPKSSSKGKISYPASASIFALDPDIPAKQQRILFMAHTQKDLQWWLNGQLWGATRNTPLWPPVRGTYTLELRDGKTVLDKAKFEVR